MNPRFLILVDSFKDSISSNEIGKLLHKLIPNSDYYPISDGGEGFLDTIKYIKKCDEIKLKTYSPSFKEIEIAVLIDEEKNAYLESSQIIGYKYKADGNILNRSSFGIGEALKKLNQFDIKNLYLGLGGTSTSDVGVGALFSLGAKFFLSNHEEINNPSIYDVLKVESIDLSKLRRLNFNIFVVNDVTNPLIGNNGANYVFAEQKGASKQDIKLLETCFKRFKNKIQDYCVNLENEIGDGSAGGLGFTFKHLLNAKYLQGIEFILSLINIEKIKDNYDFVITGEGKFDKQSINGKVVAGIYKFVEKEKVIIVTGQNNTKIKNHIYPIVPRYTSDINESINNPRKYLSLITSDINKDFSSLKRINHSFPAFYDANSEILILGSFPSVQSRIDGFYYMHKGNRFYKVLSKVFEEEIGSSIDEKKEFLTKHHIALYDVIDECLINGSSDGTITNVIPTDLNKLISKSKIRKILVNGKTAQKYFSQYFSKINLPIFFLPSTSARNASFNLNKLTEEYKKALD